MWFVHHPAVLAPIAVVAAAAFVWEDHPKYKRLLCEARNNREPLNRATVSS